VKKLLELCLEDIMAKLGEIGSGPIKKTLMRNGARDPFFDGREGDLKKLVNALSEKYSIRKASYDKKSLVACNQA
jgi:hypothetical protein